MANDPNSGFASREYGVCQDGKSRRYTLLFSVNGGALAILQFAAEQGHLSLFSALPYGMILFTAIMFIDIWAFGSALHTRVGEAFGPVGRLVLQAICGLIVAGWWLVALDQQGWVGEAMVAALVVKTGISLVLACLCLWVAWRVQERLKRSTAGNRAQSAGRAER